MLHLPRGRQNWESRPGTRRRGIRRWGFQHSVIVFLIAVAAAAAGQTGKSDSAALYEIVELPLRPLAISNSGWVAGATPQQKAATWSRTTGLQSVPLPAAFSFSECTAINSRGDAVGTASTADSSKRVAFLFRDNEVTLLPGEQARANGLNDSDGIAGQAILPPGKSMVPLFWRDSSPLSLPICCAGAGKSINNQGIIAGDTYDKQGHYHAFVWDATHGARLVSIPAEQYSSALALNDKGEVLVKATPGGLFIDSGGTLRSIEIPKSTPRAMNGERIVVGSFGPGPEAQRAFVWDLDHGLRDLNLLIPGDSGWKLEVASGINDRGEIVGWGDHNGVENAGFLLHLKTVGKSEKSSKPSQPNKK